MSCLSCEAVTLQLVTGCRCNRLTIWQFNCLTADKFSFNFRYAKYFVFRTKIFCVCGRPVYAQTRPRSSTLILPPHPPHLTGHLWWMTPEWVDDPLGLNILCRNCLNICLCVGALKLSLKTQIMKNKSTEYSCPKIIAERYIHFSKYSLNFVYAKKRLINDDWEFFSYFTIFRK